MSSIPILFFDTPSCYASMTSSSLLSDIFTNGRTHTTFPETDIARCPNPTSRLTLVHDLTLRYQYHSDSDRGILSLPSDIHLLLDSISAAASWSYPGRLSLLRFAMLCCWVTVLRRRRRRRRRRLPLPSYPALIPCCVVPPHIPLPCYDSYDFHIHHLKPNQIPVSSSSFLHARSTGSSFQY